MIKNNTTELRNILARVNALPEADDLIPPEPVLQEKVVTPTKSTQEVAADANYDGLSKVTVNAIPNEYIVPSGNKEIISNGSYDVTSNASVTVAVPSEEPVLQEKIVTPSTSTQTVTPDSTYDGLSKVTVNAMPTATQATPVITVAPSSGLISAKATQSAGYVSAGDKTATQQLSVQGAKTITPTTSNQIAVSQGKYTTGDIIVAAIPSSYVKPSATKGATTYTPTTTDQTISSGTYLTGTQTIKGDSNLVAGNIKKGTSIFGISGSFEGGEDVTDETDTYTDLLDELEGAVNDLPEATEEPVIEPLTVTANGTYTAPSGVAGYSPVTVSVASSGSSGASIETVTVTIYKGEWPWVSFYDAPRVFYTALVNGIPTLATLENIALESTYELKVVKNTILFAINGYENLSYDEEWDSEVTIASGGDIYDMVITGSNMAVGAFRIFKDCVIIMD